MLRLGPITLQTNLLLAPIAGYCDLAFRTVCREWGGVGLACTDLLSPQGLLRGTATSLDLARTNDFDKPVGMQLYGSDPELMAEGARWAVEHGATLVDINMGCPVDKVTKKDGGSKLLTDLSRAVAIASRVVRELEKCPLNAEQWRARLGGARHEQGLSGPVPLTCKMRLCWHTSDFESGAACSPHLARMLADVGVVGVTVHGRTTEDKFAGSVRLEGISRVVEAVNGAIPVIGNGDVRSPEDAARMLSVTGCQGVMIGRGALSMPWIFRDVWAHLTASSSQRERAGGWVATRVTDSQQYTTDRITQVRSPIPCATGSSHLIPSPPTEAEILATVRRFFDLMREYRDDRYALFQINRRVSWFAKTLQRPRANGGLESVKPFKEAIRNAESAEAVYDALDRFAAGELRGGWEPAEATL